MNKKEKISLVLWCKDHYWHFDCMPLEFENNKGKVYDYSEYIKYLLPCEINFITDHSRIIKGVKS